MKKENGRVFAVFLFGLWVSLSCVFLYSAYTRKEKRLKNERKAYYFSMSVPRFSKGDVPYIPVQIGNQMVLAQLDLGFEGAFAFSRSILEKVQDKKFLYLKPYCKIHGTEVQTEVYEISKAKIGSANFTRLKACEASEDFFDTRLVRSAIQDQENRDEGVVGWHPFSLSNIFLDLGNSLVGFAGSLEALQQNGYGERQFIKTPLLTDRGLIEIEVEGSDGPLRCVVDTGCSYSMKNTESENGNPVEKLTLENFSKNTFLMIGGEKFGEVLFLHFPMRLPIKIDAILGMEFLKKHVLLLDFSEGYAYLSKEPSSQEK